MRVKLDNFPYQEYGFVIGKVNRMGFLPNEDKYLAQIDLVDGLMSSYGHRLEFSPEMSAIGEVVTDDLRLIGRLFNSLKALFDS